MKKTLKIIGGVFAAFFALVVILLITDISNDVEYQVIDEKPQTDSMYIRVKTAASEEEDLKTIMNDVKDKYEDKNIDAIWLWILNDSDKSLANVQIAFNDKGRAMIGSGDEDYIFKMQK